MSLIRTQRTIVDLITLEDAPFFVTLLNTPGWLRFIGDRGVACVDDAERYLENGILKSQCDNGFSYYLVKTLDLKPFAISGFLKKPHLENPDFGFAQLPEYDGQGLAVEYSQAIIEYGVQTFGLMDMDAEVSPGNERSINLLKKLGFRKVDAHSGEARQVEVYRRSAN